MCLSRHYQVLFDPSQKKNPNGANEPDFPAGIAAFAVYLQAYKAAEEFWPYQKLSIWRANEDQDQAANVLVQVDVDAVPDPCRGDIDPPAVVDSETVTPGSEVTDVGPEAVAGDGGPGQHFVIKDSAGNYVLTDCTFKGNGYKPDASSGLFAGTLACDNGYTVNCLRHFNNLATTCGNKPLSSCGILGKGCAPYYQLLAECRI